MPPLRGHASGWARTCGYGAEGTRTPDLRAASASLFQLSYSPRRCDSSFGSADRAGRGFAPQVFEPVVLACLGREDVHDHVPVVHEDPAGLAVALGAAGQEAVVAALLQLLVDPVVDRLRLALGVARGDHEEVRVGDDSAQVDHADVDRLLVGGDLRDPLRKRRRVHWGGRAHGVTASSARPAPYRSLEVM